MIEAGESYLEDLGFTENRIRVYGDLIRIEVSPNKLDHIFEHREDIVEKLKSLGFKYVNIDLEGYRSGSMDETLDKAVKQEINPWIDYE